MAVVTAFLRLRNIGTLGLHGRHPGEEWLIQTDASGYAKDPLWRKRLADEQRYNVGVIKIVGTETAEVATPEPSPETIVMVPDIGRFLDLFGLLADRLDLVEAITAKPAPIAQADPRVSGLIEKIDGITNISVRVDALEKWLADAMKA